MRQAPLIGVVLAMLPLVATSFAQDIRDPPYYPTSVHPPVFGPLADNCCPPFVYESPLATTYATADIVAFRRDWQTTQPIATLDTPTDVVLTTGDLPFVYQPGLRLVIGRRINEGLAIEANYLGLLNWNERRAVADVTENVEGLPGNLFSPFTNFGDPAVIGLDYNSFASVRIRSNFNNVELNLRRIWNTPPSCIQASGLCGFRYINLDEQFEYRTQSFVPDPAGTANAVNVTTKNNLFGLQAGFLIDARIEPRFWLDFEAKFMLLYNATSQATEFTTGPLAGAGTTVDGSHSQGRMTLGADMAMFLVWKFSPAIIGRVGYQCVFLNGLAVAADNFTLNAPFMTSNPSELSDTGHLAYHGPFGGVTVTW